MAADCARADESFDSFAAEETVVAAAAVGGGGGGGGGADGKLVQTAPNVVGESEAAVRWPGVSCP